jgi:hypothetical protein
VNVAHRRHALLRLRKLFLPNEPFSVKAWFPAKSRSPTILRCHGLQFMAIVDRACRDMPTSAKPRHPTTSFVPLHESHIRPAVGAVQDIYFVEIGREFMVERGFSALRLALEF